MTKQPITLVLIALALNAAPAGAEDLESEKAIVSLLSDLYDGGPEVFELACKAQKGKLTRQQLGARMVHTCVHSPTFEVGLSVTPSGRSASTIARVHRNRYPALQKVLRRKFGAPREDGSALVYGANGIEYYLGQSGSKTNVMYVIPSE